MRVASSNGRRSFWDGRPIMGSKPSWFVNGKPSMAVRTGGILFASSPVSISVGFPTIGRRGPLNTRRYLSLTIRAVCRTFPKNSTFLITGGLCGRPTGLNGDPRWFENVRERMREMLGTIPEPASAASLVPKSLPLSTDRGSYFSPLTSIPIPYHFSSSAVHAFRASSPMIAESWTRAHRRNMAKRIARLTNPQMMPNAIFRPRKSFARAASDKTPPPPSLFFCWSKSDDVSESGREACEVEWVMCE